MFKLLNGKKIYSYSNLFTKSWGLSGPNELIRILSSHVQALFFHEYIEHCMEIQKLAYVTLGMTQGFVLTTCK